MSFRDETKSLNERVEALINELTTEEKIGLLSGAQQAVERLGIKEREIGTEYARGWSSHDPEWYCTVLPQTIGLVASFDPDLIHEAGKIAGRESRAYYNSVNKSLFGFGPTVDLERDPRWGRHEEGYGEDPFLTGEMATAYTTGIVGDGPVKAALPLLKHFVCNNTETIRDRYNAEVPEKLLQEYYYEVFRKPIEKGGAFGVMTAYNKLNGHPGLVSPTNQKWVKDTWGGKLIVSDGHAFAQIMESHGLTKSHAETIALAVKAGANIMLDPVEMVSEAARNALKEGLMDENDLNRAIRDTLYLRFVLGEFDDPKKDPFKDLTRDDVNTDKDREIALKMCEEQVVILKNNGILPLKKEGSKTIAVIGPQADENFLDWYTGASSYDITIKDGFKEIFADADVLCDHGRDVVKLKNVSTGKYIRLDEDQTAVCDADAENADEFEKYDWGFGYVNFMSVKTGKMITEEQGVYKATAKDAYLWFVRPIITPCESEMDGVKGVTFTSWNKGKVVMDDKNHLIMAEENAKQTAKDIFGIEVVSDGDKRCEALIEKSDVVICCMGNHPVQVGREGYDRESIELAKRQADLTRLAAKKNKNTILLMVSSYPFGVDEFDQNCAAVVYTTHAGPELGRAVARCFAGMANPSGKLASTWYKKDHVFPSIFEYDIEKSGMTYLYLKEEPLYPFGYGLNYSSFAFDDVKADGLNVTFKLKNTSDVDGVEVAQIYFAKKESAYSRPIKKLCAFKRVFVKAGCEEEVTLTVDSHMLEAYDVEKEQFVLEAGEYEFMVGANSRDLPLRVRVTL